MLWVLATLVPVVVVALKPLVRANPTGSAAVVPGVVRTASSTAAGSAPG